MPTGGGEQGTEGTGQGRLSSAALASPRTNLTRIEALCTYLHPFIPFRIDYMQKTKSLHVQHRQLQQLAVIKNNVLAVEL